jgi:hypothetical protein
MTNSRCEEIRRLVLYPHDETAEVTSGKIEGEKMNEKCLISKYDPYFPNDL